MMRGLLSSVVSSLAEDLSTYLLNRLSMRLLEEHPKSLPYK